MENKTASVFPAAFPGAPVIYLNTYSDEGQQVFDIAQAAGCPPFTLVAISDLDWIDVPFRFLYKGIIINHNKNRANLH